MKFNKTMPLVSYEFNLLKNRLLYIKINILYTYLFDYLMLIKVSKNISSENKPIKIKISLMYFDGKIYPGKLINIETNRIKWVYVQFEFLKYLNKKVE